MYISFESNDELERWLQQYFDAGVACNYNPDRLRVIQNGVRDFTNQVRTWKDEALARVVKEER